MTVALTILVKHIVCVFNLLYVGIQTERGVIYRDDINTNTNIIIIILIIKLYFNTIKSGTAVPFTGVYIHVNS